MSESKKIETILASYVEEENWNAAKEDIVGLFRDSTHEFDALKVKLKDADACEARRVKEVVMLHWMVSNGYNFKDNKPEIEKYMRINKMK